MVLGVLVLPGSEATSTLKVKTEKKLEAKTVLHLSTRAKVGNLSEGIMNISALAYSILD